jgi:DNA-binding transcriptional regulator YhcF (GntR family)
MMKYRSDHPVMAYFLTTKHVIAPRVYWSIRHTQYARGTVSLREIAFLVGSNRISVSRALRLLRELKLIKYRRVASGIVIEDVLESFP